MRSFQYERPARRARAGDRPNGSPGTLRRVPRPRRWRVAGRRPSLTRCCKSPKLTRLEPQGSLRTLRAAPRAGRP